MNPEASRSPAQFPRLEPLILSLAPTGMVPTRAMSPHVPLGVDEIVKDVLAAAEVGITLAHLHARDDSGAPTPRKDVYARIIGGIREKRPDLVLCVSCSGRHFPDIKDRAEVLELEGDLKPDMASLTPSSLNFTREASVNAPNTVRELAQRMKDRGIVPEVEIFDLGMINVLKTLQARDLAPASAFVNLLLGNVATAQADLLEIGTLVNRLPAGSLWNLAGFGSAQLPVAALAAGHAPGVRVGLEDNLWLDAERTRPADNLGLVRSVHDLAAVVGRTIMSPIRLRELLGLPGRAP
jgi:uncharacterized protein (DUF849 family)